MINSATKQSHFNSALCFLFLAFVLILSRISCSYLCSLAPVVFVWLLFSNIIGSAEALPILCVRYFRWERERERRKWRHHSRLNWRWIYTFPCQKFAQLAMSLHFPLPKIRTFRFSLHTSRLSLHGEVTIVALKFAMSSHFPLPKNFRPLCSPSFKWHEPCDEWSKTQDKWSNPAQSYIVLPNEKMNQINTKNYWK